MLSSFAYTRRCRGARHPAGECEPGEAAHLYGHYLLVNLSWLAGSLGTLLLDLGIFVQFFLYNRD